MYKKRGQLTLFVILGLVIIAVIGFLAFTFSDNIRTVFIPSIDTDSFEYCIGEGVHEVFSELAPTAGIRGDYFGVQYRGEKIPYLCYSDEYYKPCVVQIPFLEEQFESTLEVELEGKVNDCYNSYVEDFQRQGYNVVRGNPTIKALLQMGGLKITIDAPITVSDPEAAISSESITFDVPTQIYDILLMADNIVKFETTYGEYDVVASQVAYPQLPVSSTKLGDGTAIYTIFDGDTKFNFAVRSYVFPPGYSD